MLQKLYSRLHCLVGLLVLVSLAGCNPTHISNQLERYEAYKLHNADYIKSNKATCAISVPVVHRTLNLMSTHEEITKHLHLTFGFAQFMCGHPESHVETALIRTCNKRFQPYYTDCIIGWKEDYGDVLRDYVAVNLGKWRAKQQRQQQQAVQQQQRQQQQVTQQQQQQAMQGRSNTCKSFGFKENTEAHAQCMFDLFKLEQQAAAHQLAIQSQAAQNQAVQSQAASNAAAQRALLQQQLDQQKFNQNIELMQQGLNLMNPPKRPTTTCIWNEVANMMRCR